MSSGRDGDISILRAIGTLFILPFTAVIIGVGCTLSGLKYLILGRIINKRVSIAEDGEEEDFIDIPRTLISSAIIQSYRVLWVTDRVGPNIKTVVSIAVLPVCIVLSPIVLVLACFIWGIIHGFLSGVNKGPVFAVVDSFKAVDDFYNHTAYDAMGEMVRYDGHDLLDGETPFDIKIFEAIRGVLAAAFTIVILVPLISLLALFWSPKAFFKGYTEVVFESAGPVIGLLTACIIPPVVILLVLLSPVASLLWSLWEGCKIGYTRGLTHAIASAFGNVGDFNQMAAEF